MTDLLPPPPQDKPTSRRAWWSAVVGGTLMVIGIVLAFSIGMFLGIAVSAVFAFPFLILGALIASGAFISRQPK